MPRLWRHPDFLKLWAGQTVSQFGTSISMIGLPLTAVLVLHASAFQMGLLGGSAGIAVLLFGLLAGVVADRLPRRFVLILSDVGRAMLLGTIPLAAWAHRLSMNHLYAVAAGVAALGVFFDASYKSYVPGLVGRDHLLEANSKLALTESTAEVAGPGLTGVLIQWLTAPMAILFDAVSFAVSAVSIWAIAEPEIPQPFHSSSVSSEIAGGLRVAWRQPLLRALMQRTITAYFFMGFISSLYFLFTLRELHLTVALVGILISIGGASGLLGGFFAERIAHRFGVGPTIIGSAFLVGVASLLTPLARGPLWLCVAILASAQLLDIAWSVLNIQELTLRQTVTPDQYLGRVNAAMHLLSQGVLPIGALVGGSLAGVFGVRRTLLLGAAGVLLSTLWLLFSPLRSLRNPASLDAVPATALDAAVANRDL